MIKEFYLITKMKVSIITNSVLYFFKNSIFKGFIEDSYFNSTFTKIIFTLLIILYAVFKYFIFYLLLLVLRIEFYDYTSFIGHNTYLILGNILVIILLTYKVRKDVASTTIFKFFDVNKNNYFLIDYFHYLVVILLSTSLYSYFFSGYYEIDLYLLTIINLVTTLSLANLLTSLKHKKILLQISRFTILMLSVTILLINNNILSYTLLTILVLSNIISIKLIKKYSFYNDYKKIKDIERTVDINTSMNEIINTNNNSNKTGIKYLNDIFLKRYNQSIKGNLGMYIIINLIIISLFYSDTIVNNAGILLLIILFLNKGLHLMKLFYMNSDYYLLHYNFFVNKKITKKLFLERLITTIKLNLKNIAITGTVGPLLFLLSNDFDIDIFLKLILFFIISAILTSVLSMFVYYIYMPFYKKIINKRFKYYVIYFIIYYIALLAMLENISIDIFLDVMIPLFLLSSILLFILTYLIMPFTFNLKEN